MGMAATKNAGGLIAARFFLGVPESGIGMNVVNMIFRAPLMIPSAVYCILLFFLVNDSSSTLSKPVTLTLCRYLPKERAFRLGILFSANALGVGTSNLLAVAIDNVREHDPPSRH
jgi:hypothetical protein